MLDRDLAKLYGVTTFNLNKAVKRNLDRFPEDFMFQLDLQEVRNLIFQFGISSWGGTRKLPRAFTEQYERNVTGLGERFGSEVRQAIERLLEYPELGVPMDADLRRLTQLLMRVVAQVIGDLDNR